MGEYADSGNKDRLLFFNGEECVYDSLGRPSTYRGNDVEWTHVNRLAEINGASIDISDRISYTESDNIATKLAILNPLFNRCFAN